MPDPQILHVGDTVESQWGRAAVIEITVCLRPWSDPKGDAHGVDTDAVEFAPGIEGKDGTMHPPVPFVADLDNGHYIYPWEVKLAADE